MWNAAVLLILFFVSLFLRPMLDSVPPKFGSVIVFIAHVSLVGMIGFFEFLVCQIYFSFNLHRKVAYLCPTFFFFSFFFLKSSLELRNGSHAVLVMIAVNFIERTIHKILICLPFS